jgi:hypothetical protein
VFYLKMDCRRRGRIGGGLARVHGGGFRGYDRTAL